MNQNTKTTVNGVAPTYLAIRNFEVETGRPFTDLDIDRMARVAILGPVTATDLFAGDDPIDQMIKINGVNFRVIGILKAKGDSGFWNMDDQVLVPYTIAMKQLFGQTTGGTPNVIGEIDIQADDRADLKAVQDGISVVLRKRHRLAEGAQDDFAVRNQADQIAAMTAINDTLTYLLGGAAVISLLIGGIGIMNIMLVTVTERTREIGVRKAIGAKENSLLLQFLLESVIVCGVGGIIGILVGFGGVWGLSKMPMFSPMVEWWTVLAAFAVSGAVGVFFGFYPAWRAARLDPIEALRYE
jgi:putative ABC transport system permease protein